KKETPVAMQFFALEDFDPEDAFVSFLPGIVEGDTFFKRESGNERIQEQKRVYSGHFHIEGLIRNLRIKVCPAGITVALAVDLMVKVWVPARLFSNKS